MTFNWLPASNSVSVTEIILFSLVIALFVGGFLWRMSYGKRDERRDGHKD